MSTEPGQVHQGQLDPPEGGIPTTIVPTTVQAVLAHRIEGLADTTQQVLRAASVLGQQFRFEELGALSQRDADAVEGALEEAQRVGLVLRHLSEYRHSACNACHEKE